MYILVASIINMCDLHTFKYYEITAKLNGPVSLIAAAHESKLSALTTYQGHLHNQYYFS
jgi:hypothetical protein